MKTTYVSVIVPIYNERQSLRELVGSLDHTLRDSKWKTEYIFIDDGSTDGSFGELIKLKKLSESNFKIVRFRKNLGKSAALSVGFRRAKGEIIVTLDADLQDEPSEIPKLIRLLQDGNDFVVGWRERRIDQSGKIRLSRVFNTVVSRVMNVPLHDMNSGLKAMKKQVADEIDLYGELHRFIPVLASAKGFKVTEAAVTHHERKYGVSKFGNQRILRAAFDLLTTVFLTSFKTRPMHIFGLMGVIVGLSGIFPLLYLTYLHFIGESIGRRPLLLMGILFVLFGLQLLSTGLIAELIVSNQIKKEQYPISEIIE